MRIVAVALLVVVSACASSRGTSTVSRDVITAEDIEPLNVSSAMDAVQRLHPEFLRGRGRNSIANADAQYPVVYIDGVRAGELDVLRSIAAHDVREIRFISAADATTRYGTGHTGGVIEVRIRG